MQQWILYFYSAVWSDQQIYQKSARDLPVQDKVNCLLQCSIQTLDCNTCFTQEVCLLKQAATAASGLCNTRTHCGLPLTTKHQDKIICPYSAHYTVILQDWKPRLSCLKTFTWFYLLCLQHFCTVVCVEDDKKYLQVHPSVEDNRRNLERLWFKNILTSIRTGLAYPNWKTSHPEPYS